MLSGGKQRILIILTALSYAFHHVGFQPEHGKRVFVGLLYATVYRIGNGAFLVFPFLLGVGGIYDVLIQSQNVAPIMHPEIPTLFLGILILMTVAFVWTRGRRQWKAPFRWTAQPVSLSDSR